MLDTVRDNWDTVVVSQPVGLRDIAVMRKLAVVIAALAATSCATSSSDKDATREALAVCISFYEITDDVKAGIIDSYDTGPRMEQVWDQARSIDNDIIRQGVADSLASVNNRRPFGPSLDRLGNECMRLADQ